MNFQYRAEILKRLGEYILSEEEAWKQAREKAFLENNWFIPGFVDFACRRIAEDYLESGKLELATQHLQSARAGVSGKNADQSYPPKSVGIVMAGNIPLVGFHDWMAVFLSGHQPRVKTSTKDRVLIRHLAEKISEWDPQPSLQTLFSDMLKGCDAYIATGSNNSSRYFEYYFARYPHIIRRNRTGVAILTGEETGKELEGLADDVFLYFGLGCRNVTKLYVPKNYDFVPLLEAFKKYSWMADHHRYRNNFDYNLALLIMNKKYYMTNGSVLLVETESVFSPIGQLNYEFYEAGEDPSGDWQGNPDLQCVVGHGFLPFGRAQYPSITDFADGIDSFSFLGRL